MSKEAGVIVLGVLVALIPQLGVPSAWRTVFLTLCGIGLIVLGLYLRAESMHRFRKGGAFVENHPFEHASESADNADDSRKEGITSLN